MISEERGVKFQFDRRVNSAPAAMSAEWISRLKRAAARLGFPNEEMPSGAGHDAAVFAKRGVPSAMIFVRNENGSHNPQEKMELADFLVGVSLMRHLLWRQPMSLDRLFDTVSAASRATNRTVTIRRPDDWHIHLRDGEILKADSSLYHRAVCTRHYHAQSRASGDNCESRGRLPRSHSLCPPAGSDFTPLMTCYLTDEISPDEIETGFNERVWIAAKLYPAGATTNSRHGVSDLKRINSVLSRMERIGMPLLVHGETTDPQVDIFDREAVFIERELRLLMTMHQGLRIVLEHATTTEAVDVVRANRSRMAATITPHHLVINRNSLFQGGLRPHLYCLPVAKRERHRLALRRAATSGENCFFIGTDTAPHPRTRKEASCCSAGVFCGATALQTYIQVFEEEEALDRFEAFASLNGAKFHGLQPNAGTITLERKPSRAITEVGLEEDAIMVFRGGESLPWSISGTAL